MALLSRNQFFTRSLKFKYFYNHTIKHSDQSSVRHTRTLYHHLCRSDHTSSGSWSKQISAHHYKLLRSHGLCRVHHLYSYQAKLFSVQARPELSLDDNLVFSYVKHLKDKFDEANTILTTRESENAEGLKEAKKTVAELAVISQLYESYEGCKAQLGELQEMSKESGDDREMKKMLEEEIEEMQNGMEELEEQVNYLIQ